MARKKFNMEHQDDREKLAREIDRKHGLARPEDEPDDDELVAGEDDEQSEEERKKKGGKTAGESSTEDALKEISRKVIALEERIKSLEKKVTGKPEKNEGDPKEDCPDTPGDPDAPVTHAEASLGVVDGEDMLPEEHRVAEELVDMGNLTDHELFPSDRREAIKEVIFLWNNPDLWNDGAMAPSKWLQKDSALYHRCLDAMGVRRVEDRPFDITDGNGNIDTRLRVRTRRKKKFLRGKKWVATVYIPIFTADHRFEGFEEVEVESSMKTRLLKRVQRVALERR